MAIQIELLADHTALVPRLVRLYEEEWGSHRPDETLEQKCDRMLANCGRGNVPMGVVALEGTELRGAAFLLRNDLPSRSELTPWLGGVYVIPEFRRQGIGRALIEYVVELARSSGVATLYLFTDKAEALYARLDWVPIERTTHKGKAVVVMARSIVA